MNLFHPSVEVRPSVSGKSYDVALYSEFRVLISEVMQYVPVSVDTINELASKPNCRVVVDNSFYGLGFVEVSYRRPTMGTTGGVA